MYHGKGGFCHPVMALTEGSGLEITDIKSVQSTKGRPKLLSVRSIMKSGAISVEITRGVERLSKVPRSQDKKR